MTSTKQIGIESSAINNPTAAFILSFAWKAYITTHKVRDIVLREVEKTLSCRSKVFLYKCGDCHKTVHQLLGCNSRLCSRCGKRYNDQWAKSLSKAMFNVPHRHFVLTIHSQLWSYLLKDRTLWKVYMNTAIETCGDYFQKIMRNPHIKPGLIVVMHPFGKDMKFQPHLHVIVTEGGFTGKGQFIQKKFFPVMPLSRKWQYHISRNFQKAGLPNQLFTELYAKYDGFRIWVHKAGRIENTKKIAKYLGRYVRHPAIANSRITRFDGKEVTFYYEREDRNGNKTRHDVTMSVNEFITALTQHIPDNQFKMVRYYGAYARRRKKVFGCYASQSSIGNSVQDTLYMTGYKNKPFCPFCGGMLKFVGYETIPPPGDYFHWMPKKESLAVWGIRSVSC